MNVGQSTIEKLAWWVVVLILILSIATFVKLWTDDNHKFKVLKTNQDQLLCIIKGIYNPQNYTVVKGQPVANTMFIDNCIKENR